MSHLKFKCPVGTIPIALLKESFALINIVILDGIWLHLLFTTGCVSQNFKVAIVTPIEISVKGRAASNLPLFF